MEPLLEGLEKTSYHERNTRVKVFGHGFKKSDILNEALNQARVEETGLRIPKLLEVRKVDGKWAIVTEFVEGETLQALSQDACSAHDAGSLEEAAAADGMRLKICVHCVFLPIIFSCLGSMAQGTLPCRFPTPTRLSAPLYYQRIQKSAETDPSVCACAPPVKSLTRHILYHRNK